jgi:uncharacterized protein YegJ (DUF2314 family)
MLYIYLLVQSYFRLPGVAMKSFTAVLLLTCCFACNQKQDLKPDTLIKDGYNETEMDAAIKRAQSETDTFLKELANPTGTMHAVKAPITDDNGTEHFWINELIYKDGEFEGVINNDPGIVKNVKLGQKWKIKKEDISDWTFMKNDKLYGNYTMRPLLKTLPLAEAAKYKAMLAEP